MLELVPHAKSIWVPYQRNYPIIDSQLRVLHKAAAKKGVTILESPADDAHEIQQILQQKELSDHIDMDAILFIVEPLTVTSDVFVVIGKFAFKHKIPLGGALISAQEYSSVFGVNVDIIKTGERAAISADKILSGTPAGTIPVISAESHFEINYTAAKKLGIEIPDGLLSKADRVIR
jgi:putative ABC transport system substrate-binding protein